MEFLGVLSFRPSIHHHHLRRHYYCLPVALMIWMPILNATALQSRWRFFLDALTKLFV